MHSDTVQEISQLRELWIREYRSAYLELAVLLVQPCVANHQKELNFSGELLWCVFSEEREIGLIN